MKVQIGTDAWHDDSLKVINTLLVFFMMINLVNIVFFIFNGYDIMTVLNAIFYIILSISYLSLSKYKSELLIKEHKEIIEDGN